MRNPAKKSGKTRQILGDPVALHRELRSFRKAALALSSDHPRLIDLYPNQWVAVYDGKVTAHGKTLDSVLEEMRRKGIPQGRTIVRYIDRNERTLIL